MSKISKIIFTAFTLLSCIAFSIFAFSFDGPASEKWFIEGWILFSTGSALCATYWDINNNK